MAAHILFRPLPTWIDPVTSPRQGHSFTAGWIDTCDLLRREVEAIAPRATTDIVLEVCADPRWVRRDGGLRADAKVTSPGVVVSFESVHGPLRYVCDTFEARWAGQMPGWQANVRAIALGLEALRKVNRYGIAGSGQQYTGWAALGAGSTLTPEQEALETLRRHAGLSSGPDYDDAEGIKSAWRAAARATHPDRPGGDRHAFEAVQAAYQLLAR